MVRAITSVAITLPCVWYLWPPSKKSHEHGHGNGHGHDEHISHKDAEESSNGADNAEDTESTEAVEKGRVDKQPETDSVKSDDSGNKEVEQDTPEDESDTILHEKEDGTEDQGVTFKGPTKNTPPGDTRKHIPDAKGANKKRIESDYGKRQGVAEGDDATVQEPGNVKDKVCDDLQMNI